MNGMTQRSIAMNEMVFPRIISHRGNLCGESIGENSKESIDAAIDLGFDVEVDLWLVGSQFYFGHDLPKYEVSLDYLLQRKDRLWIHCKNLDALLSIVSLETCKDLDAFWHQNDYFTLTKKDYIWTYPGHQVTNKSVIVALSQEDARKALIYQPYGICTDYPLSLNH